MKKIIITFALIGILALSCIHFGDIHFKNRPSDVMSMFFSQLFEATPETSLELNALSKADFEYYIKTKYSSIATDQMMNDLYSNGYIIDISEFARTSNAQVRFSEIVISDQEESDGQKNYVFDGTGKVTYLETEKEDVFSFSGAFELINTNGNWKMNSFNLYENDLLD